MIPQFMDEELTTRTGWQLFDEADGFNRDIRLDDTVKANENMFIGKQWEGVEANGLPKPQMNFIKRIVMFKVSTLCSDSIKVNATALQASPNTEELLDPARIVTEEFDALTERNSIVHLTRRFCRDAAVRGDGCLYTYWDDEEESGAVLGERKLHGAIKTEVIQNTRVYFGNPNDNRVEKQPWIMIRTLMPCKEARRRCEKYGDGDPERIRPDADDQAMNQVHKRNDKVTDLLLMWKEGKEVYAYEFCKDTVIREPYSLGLRRYPVVWLNWDYVQDSYHGQAEVTGLIPNQISYNKTWAATILSILTNAFPKIIYDPTRIKSWTNQIGAAIKAPGGDVNNVAKVIDPAPISPQVYQYLDALVTQTQQSMGVTSVALGDTRPDNTSAIVALQRAASTPMELTKLELYDAIEDLFRVYLEFMAEYYGKRTVDTETPPLVRQALEFAAEGDPMAEPVPDKVPMEFDFGTLKDITMNLKLDVGASSYFSEMAATQTLDNLLKIGAITPVQYLKRIPDGSVKDKEGLIREIEEQQRQAMEMQQAAGTPKPSAAKADNTPLIGGNPYAENDGRSTGYSILQRKINQGKV